VSRAPVDTVLVTGAFGQVGRRCAEILLGRGRNVLALDLPGENSVAAARTLSDSAHSGTLVTAYTDLLDAEAVRALVAEQQPDAIVHLAAILAPASYRNPALARKVNVGGRAISSRPRAHSDGRRSSSRPPARRYTGLATRTAIRNG
jgi:UDP-glucose 4-epimerase